MKNLNKMKRLAKSLAFSAACMLLYVMAVIGGYYFDRFIIFLNETENELIAVGVFFGPFFLITVVAGWFILGD